MWLKHFTFAAAEWREHPFWRLKQCPAHYRDSTVSCCSCGRLQPQADEWASLQVAGSSQALATDDMNSWLVYLYIVSW
jgi:hypothetical protein